MKTESMMAPGAKPMEDAASREGKRIARAIFRAGDEPTSPCTRLQFKGGDWPDAERNQGGLVESSLAALIADCLRNTTRGT